MTHCKSTKDLGDCHFCASQNTDECGDTRDIIQTCKVCGSPNVVTLPEYGYNFCPKCKSVEDYIKKEITAGTFVTEKVITDEEFMKRFSVLKSDTNDQRTMREFGTGATRDSLEGKLDFEGFLSPLVLERYAQYLDAHRVQADGNLRDSDNWQGGMPRSVYMKSMLRHVHDAWKEHRGYESREGLEDALCGTIFNAMGYLFEILSERNIDE